MSVTHYSNITPDISHLFKLDTPSSTYILGVVDEEGFVGHFYYGDRINAETQKPFLDTIAASLRIDEPPFIPSKNNRDRGSFLDSFPMEYPTHGTGDFRQDCFKIETGDGNSAASLTFVSYEITEGKEALPGLPAVFGNKDEVTTLVLNCRDEAAGLLYRLSYSVFNDVDVITRSISIKNTGSRDVYLTRVFSACLDMDNEEFNALTLHGSWARERRMNETPINRTRLVVESVKGESSHQDNPFIAVKAKNADYDSGRVYGLNFVYSGNFKITAQEDQFGQARITMGISDEDFKWLLKAGDDFAAPEVVMVYSNEGLGKMSRTFHDLYRKHLIRSPYKDMKRPILINNWEATYFNFDTDKLISIAKEASKLGIEMLVMDDGWFGNRFDDNRALGDWTVNEEKLKGGLKYLVDEVNKLGMKFGIWFEPEMISPESELYKAHPDWAIAVKGRTPTRSRNQYVLDLSREDVLEYTYESVAMILRSANIEYVKWDMNRQLTDLGSAGLPADRMGELSHRYMLGVYALQEKLLKEFPKLLLENCSGGGARFDAGMLYYSPQIWCSDDIDPIERLSIHEGTALVYPLSSMGAHIADSPNHTTGRVTPFETRGHVALAGTFGYELDVTKIPEKDRALIPGQVKMYHKYNDLVREGDYYRIASYYDNHYFDCYGVVKKDKTEALFTFVQVLGRANYHSRRIHLKGLAPDKSYKVEIEGTEDNAVIFEAASGEALMKAGLLIRSMPGDFRSILIHLTQA